MANKFLKVFKLDNFMTNATLSKAFKILFEITTAFRKLNVDGAVSRGHSKVNKNHIILATAC